MTSRANRVNPLISKAEKLADSQPHDLVAIYGLNSKCIWASPSHEDIIGYPPDEVVGQSWRKFVAPEEHAHADLAGADALLNERSIEFGFRAAAKSGRRVSLRGRAWLSIDSSTLIPYLFFQAKVVEP